MLKGFTHARLACGCRIAFREGVEGSPVTVVVDEKSSACTLPLHVRNLPVFLATFTLALTPQWIDGITAGAGWIAIALVIFAFWRPELCLVGAYFFGALQALGPQLEARSIHFGPTVLWTNSLPYVMTIVVLVLVSASSTRRWLGAPAALGTPYVREER